MNILLQLFISFVKVGFTSFGGLSMIPIISSEMLSHHWMSVSEVADIVAIAEMTPGPVGLNCSTFAGLRTAGIPGAIAAACGVLTPSFTLCLAAAIFFEHFRKNTLTEKLMTGIRPASVGLLAGVSLVMAQNSYFPDHVFSPAALAIGIIDLFLLIKCKLSIPKVILISAAAGLLCGRLGWF